MQRNERLRAAHEYLQAGDVASALRVYVELARESTTDKGSLAVWSKLRDVIRRHAPKPIELDEDARGSLAFLLRSVGLDQDAMDVERESARWN